METDLLTAAPVPDDELVPRGRPDDIAVITLTSGSTGRPKGVSLSYRALSASWAWQPARWTGARGGSRPGTGATSSSAPSPAR
ncbi:AMP-binding protein [Streptomyces sp. M19]